MEKVSRDKEQLTSGLRGYKARQETKIDPIKRDLGYVEQLIVEKNAEWEDDYSSMKFLTSDRARAKKAADLAIVEEVLKELNKRKADLLIELEEKSLTDEQIMGTVAFAAQVADDMDKLREMEARGQDNPEIRQDVFRAKRRLLAVLDVQVTLYVEEGHKKARMTAKYCPEGTVLQVDVVNTDNSGNDKSDRLRDETLKITGRCSGADETAAE